MRVTTLFFFGFVGRGKGWGLFGEGFVTVEGCWWIVKTFEMVGCGLGECF